MALNNYPHSVPLDPLDEFTRSRPSNSDSSDPGLSGRLTRLATLNTTRTADPPRPRLRPRGLPPALEPHGVYTATNAADAALFGADLLGTHRVHVKPSDARSFIATYHAVLFRDVTLGYLDYGVDVVVDIRATTSDQLVIVPAAGSSAITAQGETVTTSPVVAVTPRPGEPLRIQCDGETAHLIFRIDRAALLSHASRLVGRPLDDVPVFQPRFDLTSASASRWTAAVHVLHAELHEPESLLNLGTGIGQIEEFLMSSLLYSQTSDLTPQLLVPHRKERQTVQQARDFIDRHMADPITIHDLAKSANVTVRTLQQHFRDDLRQSPTEYLRDRRLDRIRDDLADASPTAGVTVADIAARWGVAHLGRFSAAYRRRFGELPSETLRH